MCWSRTMWTPNLCAPALDYKMCIRDRFYTAEGPAQLLAKLATVGLDEIKSVCDPCGGSGSLLLRVQDELSSHKVGHFYADELLSLIHI